MGKYVGTVPTLLAGEIASATKLLEITNFMTAVTAAATAYTPVWTANGTAPSLGNGAITGDYRWVGKWCRVRITLTMGSTTTFGTGFYLFSTPAGFVALAIAGSGKLGAAKFLDAGVQDRNGVSYMNDTTHVVATSNAGAAGQTVPHTWGSTDVFTVDIEIEGT